MKAAIITVFDPYRYKGGIEKYTLQLTELLTGCGITVDLYHSDLINEDMGFHNKLLGKMYVLGQKFFEVDKKYDFVIANSFYGMGYFPPRIKAFNIYHSSHVAFDKSIKGVISHVTSLEWTYLCGYLGERASGFNRLKLAVSEEVKEELETYYGFDDVRVVESAIDISLFSKIENRNVLRRKYAIPYDAFVGLFVGRWDKTKGKDIVEQVVKKTPDIHWLLVFGTGSEDCNLKERKNVTILEEVPYEEMPAIYSLSDFMFFPSRYEGFGLVIIEAMACGLPVFAGEIGIAKKIYRREPFINLKIPIFSSDKDDLISESIQKIYSLRGDNKFMGYISREGRRLIEKEYCMDRWRIDMLKALDLS